MTISRHVAKPKTILDPKSMAQIFYGNQGTFYSILFYVKPYSGNQFQGITMTHAPASEFCLMCGALTTDPSTADRAKIVSCSKAFASVVV